MKRGRILWIAILISSVSTVPLAYGQDAEAVDKSDLQGWSSAELKYKVSKRWTLSGEGQLRLKDDMSLVDQYFGEFAAKYRLMSDVSLDGGLRFIRQNDTEGKIQGYESERQHHLSASFRPEAGRFSLDFRLRYQTKGDVTDAGYEETDRHLRFRARVRYNIRDWDLDPDFAVELWQPVGRNVDSGFDKIRFTLGTDWKAWKGGEIGTFYRLERELGVDRPETTHILGLSFTHTLGGK